MELPRANRSQHKKGGAIFATLPLYAGMLAANFLARESMVVRANDPGHRKALRAYPSALIAPETSGNRVTDTLATVGMAALSIETARRVRNIKELAFTAIASHGMACAANTVAGRWLTDEEKEQEDVGFSAIAIGVATDYMLHRADSADSRAARWAWRAGLAAVVGGSTVGSYAANDKLGATAHVAGATVGAATYTVKKRLDAAKA